MRIQRLFVLILLGLMFACTSEPKKPAQEAAAPQPTEPTLYTGREAAYKMYVAARSWQADGQPFRLESQPTKNVTGQDGNTPFGVPPSDRPAIASPRPTHGLG